jgi:hypothetical protein
VKQLKLYLFWIIAAVLFLAVLIVFFTVEPSDEQGKTPEEVKQKLDADFEKLKELEGRAKRGNPVGVFDPENQTDIKKLTDDYLLTERWKNELEPKVQTYDKEYAEIKKDLAERSAILLAPIFDSTDLLAWYTAYEGKTKEVLLSLINAKALAMPDDLGAPAAGAKTEEPSLETNERIRSVAGFYTRQSTMPEATLHARLTKRFRIIEKLAEVLINTRAKPLPNPVIASAKTTLPDALGAQLAAVDWKNVDPALKGDLANYATATEVVITLRGTSSALLAAEAAIEKVASPVMVVTGGSLVNKAGYKPGDRKMVAYDPLVSRLTIVVFDFSKIAQLPPLGGATADAKPQVKQ